MIKDLDIFKYVNKFDSELSGSIEVVSPDGDTTFVRKLYLKCIKDYIWVPEEYVVLVKNQEDNLNIAEYGLFGNESIYSEDNDEFMIEVINKKPKTLFETETLVDGKQVMQDEGKYDSNKVCDVGKFAIGISYDYRIYIKNGKVKSMSVWFITEYEGCKLFDDMMSLVDKINAGV